MPSLSIVVPVYRTAAYLPRCIRSILQQTWTDFELVLVDDEPGSRSAALCDRYAAADSRIRVIRSPRRGVWEARRAGIVAASGRYVGFVDSDDWIEADHFARLLLPASARACDVATSKAYLSHGRLTRRGHQRIAPGRYRGRRLLHGVHRRMLGGGGSGFRAVLPALWLAVFRRDVLVSVVPLVPRGLRHAEDVVVTYLSLLRSSSLVVVAGNPTYHYRVRRGSIMSSPKADYLVQCRRVCRALEREARRLRRPDIIQQVATNLVYFLVHSLFNDTLASYGAVSRAQRVRAACRRPDVSAALRSYKPGHLPLAYRVVASLLARKRCLVAAALAGFYPVVVFLAGEVV